MANRWVKLKKVGRYSVEGEDEVNWVCDTDEVHPYCGKPARYARKPNDGACSKHAAKLGVPASLLAKGKK